MRVATTEITGRRGATTVEMLFLDTFGWLPREISDSDVGIDFYVEAVTSGHATGRHIAVQAKSGSSFFDKRQSPKGWWFPFDDGHGQYWLHHDFPVIVVLVDLESGIAYWQAVTAATMTSTGEGWKVEVPSAQRLDGSALAALSELAEAPRVQGDSILAEFYTNLDRLPPEAASPLRRLHASVPRADLSARRPVERLAATLAGNRSDPDGCCALLLEKTPKWLHQREDEKSEWCGPDEREVWVAVGGYANEYALPARAAEAFRRAATVGAQPEGYWRAVGGLFEVEIASEQAKETLEAASSLDGGRILADIGLAILAHRGQPGPVPVPSSLLPQMAVDWQGIPTALLFLGDRATRHHDHDQALARYEAALDLCPGSATIQILIARTLLDRLQTHKSPSRDADLRRVLRLAEAARADRRRWDGPSDAAAAVLLQARLLLPDTEAALAAALPTPQGEATAMEAAAPGLAAFAARIAYRDGRTDTANALAARSASASDQYAAELAAARAAATGASEDEQRRLWGEALEAAADDEQRLTVCKRLAELGQWPIPVLEGLRAADAVARDLYAVMEAKARHHGDPAGALRLLRPVQNTSVYAVIAMAELLEADGHSEQAAQVLQQGGTRFADVHLDLAALDVLRRGGDQQGAEAQAFRILARPGLPRPIRLRVLHGLVRQAYLESAWSTAAMHAQNALDEIAQAHPDADPPNFALIEPLADDFIWCRIGALYNLRRWDVAWVMCDRYQARPMKRMEALIWIPLVARKPWTPRIAHAVLDLYEAFAEDEMVAARAVDAVDRALAVAHDPDSARFGAPWAPYPTPQELAELRMRAERATTDYQARYPDGSVTTVVGLPDQASLHALLGPKTEMNAAHREICQAIRDGDAALGLAAASIGRPYAQSLIQRAVGLLPAGSVDPVITNAEQRAAAAALDGVVVVDLSAVVVASMLPGRSEGLHAHFAEIQLPEQCMDDVLLTEDAIRRLLASSFTAGLSSDASTIEVTVLSPADRAYLADLTAAVVGNSADLTLVPVAGLDAAEAALQPVEAASPSVASSGLSLELDASWAAPLQVAISSGSPLWCDDTFVRETAHRVGIPAFGTLALVHELINKQRLPDSRADDHALLLAGFVVDLPLTPDLLLRQAEADLWQPGAAAVALARRAAWQSADALDTWATIATAITANAPEQLAAWVHLVSLGAAAHDSGTATLMGQVLTVAVIEGEADSAPQLIEASAGAALVRGVPAASWIAAVRSELSGAITTGHPVGRTVDDVERLLRKLVQEPGRS